MRARTAYINYTKKLRIFNILNFYCVVYMLCTHMSLIRVLCTPLVYTCCAHTWLIRVWFTYGFKVVFTYGITVYVLCTTMVNAC